MIELVFDRFSDVAELISGRVGAAIPTTFRSTSLAENDAWFAAEMDVTMRWIGQNISIPVNFGLILIYEFVCKAGRLCITFENTLYTPPAVLVPASLHSLVVRKSKNPIGILLS